MDGTHIGFERTLRPLRIGYRVDPQSADDLRRAIETATMQWGGRFHALVPTMKRRPPWWRWPAPGGPSAAELAAEYERAFDCDFVVEARPTTQEASGYREVDLAKLRKGDEWSSVRAGLASTGVYNWLWREEFRFETDQRPRPILPVPASPDMALFTEVCFGRFFADRADVEEEYRQTFEPEEVVVGPEQLLDMFALTTHQPMMSPLDAGSWGLRWMPRGFSQPAVHVVDPGRPVDLLDLWNLRASGQAVAAIPLPWLDELLPQLTSRLKGRMGQREQERLHVYTGRGTSSDTVAALREAFAQQGVQVVVLPPGDASLDFGSLMAADAEAGQGEVDGTVQHGMVEVPLLAPPVDTRAHGINAWVNTLKVRAWTLPRDGSIAPFVPSALGDVRELLGGWQMADVRAGPFGLEVTASAARDKADMRLPSGRAIIERLLAAEGYTPHASDAGTVAERLISQIGSLAEIGLLRHLGLLRLMNRAATSGVAMDVGDDELPLRARVDFIGRDALIAELNRSVGRDAAPRILEMLVERNVLRAGLSLRCAACGFINWIELDEIQPTLRCRRCLEGYPFPQATPPDHKAWGYRPTGACSVEYFARGAYTVAHALRTLEGIFEPMIWCTGTNLSPKTEIDFAAYRTRTQESGTPTLLVGEAKSLNEFKEKDFASAKRVLANLPESVFVFATMRDRLTVREKTAIKKLARPKVTSWLSVPMRPRVMVLTETELLHVGGMPDCWRDGPEHMRELYAKNERYVRDEVDQWADLTLQLHVGLRPHAEWSMRQRKRLVKAAKRKQTSRALGRR